jgi:hypothetical protein
MYVHTHTNENGFHMLFSLCVCVHTYNFFNKIPEIGLALCSGTYDVNWLRARAFRGHLIMEFFSRYHTTVV